MVAFLTSHPSSRISEKMGGVSLKSSSRHGRPWRRVLRLVWRLGPSYNHIEPPWCGWNNAMFTTNITGTGKFLSTSKNGALGDDHPERKSPDVKNGYSRHAASPPRHRRATPEPRPTKRRPAWDKRIPRVSPEILANFWSPKRQCFDVYQCGFMGNHGLVLRIMVGSWDWLWDNSGASAYLALPVFDRLSDVQVWCGKPSAICSIPAWCGNGQ